MRQLLNPLANLLAVIGIALVLITGLRRLSGNFTLPGIGTIAYLRAGMAAMPAACGWWQCQAFQKYNFQLDP